MGWNDHVMGPGYEHLREDDEMSRNSCEHTGYQFLCEECSKLMKIDVSTPRPSCADAELKAKDAQLCRARGVIHNNAFPCAVCEQLVDALSSTGPCAHERLLNEQVAATNVVTKELNECYAEIGIFRHPDNPERGPDAIKRLREAIEWACTLEIMEKYMVEVDVSAADELRRRASGL